MMQVINSWSSPLTTPAFATLRTNVVKLEQTARESALGFTGHIPWQDPSRNQSTHTIHLVRPGPDAFLQCRVCADTYVAL